MELSLLREFIVLSQTLNYTKAAEILHLTQPTLSKHIVAMEKELGCSLLERDRRRVELTESGNVFAAAALQMVDTYDDAKQRIHDIQTHTPLKVNGVMSDSAIASITSIAATFLDAEGEAPASYNSLNDTNYLENWWKAMPTSCWPMPNWTSSIIWDLPTFRSFVRPSLPWSLWTAPWPL